MTSTEGQHPVAASAEEAADNGNAAIGKNRPSVVGHDHQVRIVQSVRVATFWAKIPLWRLLEQ